MSAIVVKTVYTHLILPESGGVVPAWTLAADQSHLRRFTHNWNIVFSYSERTNRFVTERQQDNLSTVRKFVRKSLACTRTREFAPYANVQTNRIAGELIMGTKAFQEDRRVDVYGEAVICNMASRSWQGVQVNTENDYSAIHRLEEFFGDDAVLMEEPYKNTFFVMFRPLGQTRFNSREAFEDASTKRQDALVHARMLFG